MAVLNANIRTHVQIIKFLLKPTRAEKASQSRKPKEERAVQA